MCVVLRAEDVGHRLDRALVDALSRSGRPRTRSQLASAFRSDGVRVGGVVRRASWIVDAPARVDLIAEAVGLQGAEPEALPLSIVYEDGHLLVIDKAAGMAMHAGPGRTHGTLVNAVLSHLGVGADALPVLAGNDATRPGIVHRIDKDTSGLVVVAKRAGTAEALAAQFRTHTIERAYFGVVSGRTRWDTLRIHTLHGRDPVDRRRFTPEVTRGREAITSARVLSRWAHATAVEFRLETGRTHQIRMHARHVGHPLLGDPMYGMRVRDEATAKACEGLGRQALHATLLGFVHPADGERRSFRAPLPSDLDELIAALDAVSSDPR